MPRIGTVDLSREDVRLLEYLYEPPATPEDSATLASRLDQPVNVLRTRLGVLRRLELVEQPGRGPGWNLTACARHSTPWRT